MKRLLGPGAAALVITLFSILTAQAALKGSRILGGRIEGFDEKHVYIWQGARLYEAPRAWIVGRGPLREDALIEIELKPGVESLKLIRMRKAFEPARASGGSVESGAPAVRAR